MGLALRYLGPLLFAHIVLTSSVSASEPPVEKTITYSLGVVPQFSQRKLFHIWQPIVDEIEKKTGIQLKIKGSPKIPSFEHSFLAGEFDFAYMNPYHITTAHKTQGYIPLVRDGKRALQGVLVVKKDSPITQVSQLQSKSIAFPSPNALGASLLIRANLSDMKYKTSYVQTHSSVYLHVLKGLVDAGGGVQSTLNSQRPAIRDRLKVIYRTIEIPPHPIAAHPRVPSKHRKLIANAILEFSKTQQGKELLSNIPIENAMPTTINDYSVISEWKLEKYYAQNN